MTLDEMSRVEKLIERNLNCRCECFRMASRRFENLSTRRRLPVDLFVVGLFSLVYGAISEPIQFDFYRFNRFHLCSLRSEQYDLVGRRKQFLVATFFQYQAYLLSIDRRCSSASNSARSQRRHQYQRKARLDFLQLTHLSRSFLL